MVFHKPRRTCPRCRGWSFTREIEHKAGEDPRLKHFVCDNCEIGWYEMKGARNKKIIGTAESIKKAYVPKEG